MKKNYLNLMLNNIPLKISSCMLGYLCWLFISSSFTTYTTIEIPLCFYHIPDNVKINAPETITVVIAGKRSDLTQCITKNQISAHIDLQKLTLGKQIISITQEQLLLPTTINLQQTAQVEITLEQQLKLIEQT